MALLPLAVGIPKLSASSAQYRHVLTCLLSSLCSQCFRSRVHILPHRSPREGYLGYLGTSSPNEREGGSSCHQPRKRRRHGLGDQSETAETVALSRTRRHSCFRENSGAAASTLHSSGTKKILLRFVKSHPPITVCLIRPS